MKTLIFLTIFIGALLGMPLQHANAQTQSTPADGPAQSSQTDATYEYRLGSGDKIRMMVFGEPDLGGEFTISGDGKVSLPLIGEVTAGGRTATEVQALVQDSFRQGYLRDPRVNIEVLNFRPFYILGEVNKPGEYPYSNGMTVVNAVALAQGFTYRANKKKVFIRHANSTAEEDVSLDASLMVAPGDTVRIGERYF